MTNSRVTLTSRDGGAFAAYLSLPDAPNGGSVVILQEIFGINQNIRSVCDTFAQAGFNAIAPDLFWRQEPGVELNPASEPDRERATALLKGLDQQLAVEDALVAADHIRGLQGANGKVAAVGYCLGGKLAYLMATRVGIDAAVSYYGVAIQASLDQAAKVRGPLLLHIAEQDHLCPPEAQQAIEDAMAPYPDRVTVMRYPNVGHAFARRASPVFNDAAAERADAATLALLQANVATAR